MGAGWTPLAEVEELKDAFRAATGEGEEDEEPAKKKRRRTLDEVPLTHTYTSDQGILYVFDDVDEDWKAGGMYEALLKEEEEAEKTLQKKEEEEKLAAEEEEQGELTEERKAEKEQEMALEELMLEASASKAFLGAPSRRVAGAAGLGEDSTGALNLQTGLS